MTADHILKVLFYRQLKMVGACELDNEHDTQRRAEETTSHLPSPVTSREKLKLIARKNGLHDIE